MREVIVIVFDKKVRDLEKPMRRIGRELLSTVGRSVSLEVCLVGDSFMKKNVLAFPAPKNFPRPDRHGRFLGEIYLNPHYIAKEKLEIGNRKLDFSEKLNYMFAHGFLHLLGYDHEVKDDRIKMEARERKLLARLKMKL